MNRLHPELEEAVRAAFDVRPTMGKLPVGDVEARRTSVAQASGMTPSPDFPDIRVQPVAAVAPDGDAVALRLYQRSEDRSGAALVLIHGGGLIAGSLDTPSGEARAMAIASATGMTVVSVGYRLAPEHRYPVPLEDCYAALVWAAEHAGQLGIDRARIGVGGESAGGGLAAAVALLARDRNGPHLAGLYLGCPMLDPTTVLEPAGGTQWYTWSHLDNETGWRAYLPPDLHDFADAPGHAAPALAEDLQGLPPTYIDVGGLDLFRDEDIAFAARLWAAGVPCEVHVIPGAPHGFMTLAPDAPVVRRMDDARNAFLASW